MKILIVTPKYYPDTFPVNLIAERLVNEGNEVDVLTSTPFKDGKYLNNFHNKESIENGVKVFRVDAYIRTSSRLSLVRNYLSIGRLFKKWIKRCETQYDCVYTYSISPITILSSGNYYKKKYHVPHIVHVLDLWPESVIATTNMSKHSLFYRILLRRSRKEYNQASELLYGSPSFIDYLNDVIKVKNIKMTYLAQPGLIYEGEKGENPYDSNKTNLLYCGNISRLQLLDYIVPAVQKLNNPNVIFNIVGDGVYLEKIKEEIKDKNIQNIVYHGYYPYQESQRYFEYADCFYLGLNNSSFVGKTIPNKLISYLYYAKPIIGMLDGDGKEILEATGNIVAQQSIDDLVKAIEAYLCMGSKEIEKIKKKNRQYYDDHFSLDKFITKLLSSFSGK